MKIFMYTLSTCPWCQRTKQFFKDHNIPFTYIDYDLEDDREQEKILEKMKSICSQAAFPFVMIDDKVIVGYNPEKYEELISTKV